VRVLVTGGCGFIGGHTVDSLIDRGHSVVVVDDMSAPENDYFHFNKEAKYFNFDISTNDESEKFGSIDAIFHFAARSRIQPTFENPTNAFQVNVIGTQKALEWARKFRVNRFVYAGTSSLYGHHNPIPFNPAMQVECLTPYSLSKWMGERLCEFYSNLYGINSLVLRYFNVYGPREPTKGHYAPVIGLFKRQYASGKLMTVVGNGHQRRDFTYIRDVTKANIAALDCKDVGFKILNVGTGKNYSINDIARLVSKNQKLNDVATCSSQRKGELVETLADITLTKQILGWEPQIDLPTGINLY
jgi:UDP-glucose 4-epimerase